MFCTACGSQIEGEGRYCARCGHGASPAASWSYRERRLSRPREDKKIAGVCAGFARYFDADVTLVRILWLTFAVVWGIGFVAYIAAWIIMPRDPLMLPITSGQVEQTQTG
ncbi:MAG: PspC domain-containing protein [Bryobacteraceae bacterium]